MPSARGAGDPGVDAGRDAAAIGRARRSGVGVVGAIGSQDLGSEGSIARPAAMVSATRRDGPVPTPSARPSTTTSTWNCFSWSGPVDVDDAVLGPRPGPALGELLEPALRALQAASTGASIAISGRGEVQRASRGSRSKPELEVERPPTSASNVEARIDGAAPAAALGLALAEEQVAAEVDPVRPAGPARRVDTIAARRALRSPSSSAGWAREQRRRRSPG